MTTTTNNATTAKPTKTQLGVVDKLNNILGAWEDLAPEGKFAEMTLAECRTATSGTIETRKSLAANRNRISSLVSNRLAQEAALSATLKRVSAAVVVDGNFGADSPLYRAMGYVTALERKSPSLAEPAQKSVSGASSDIAGAADETAKNSKPARKKYDLERYQAMLAAWEQSEVASIGGLKLEDWKPVGEALLSTKHGLVEARIERRSLVGAKISADARTRAVMKKVVASVIASPAYGENSALYRAMGYIPGNERKAPRRRG